MARAWLPNATLMGANLMEARLEGGDLRWARLEGADLGRARLEGADLGRARLERADLFKARLEGADLREAHMKGAGCRGASFLAALVHSADLTCHRLSPEQLEFVVGNRETRLPEDLTVWSCLDRDSLSERSKAQIDAVLARYPQKVDDGSIWPISRAEYSASLFCDANSSDILQRRPAAVGGPNPVEPE